MRLPVGDLRRSAPPRCRPDDDRAAACCSAAKLRDEIVRRIRPARRRGPGNHDAGPGRTATTSLVVAAQAASAGGWQRIGNSAMPARARAPDSARSRDSCGRSQSSASRWRVASDGHANASADYSRRAAARARADVARVAIAPIARIIAHSAPLRTRSTAGRPALQRREPGQVRKEAATATHCKCRGNGSPPLLCRQIGLMLRCSPTANAHVRPCTRRVSPARASPEADLTANTSSRRRIARQSAR